MNSRNDGFICFYNFARIKIRSYYVVRHPFQFRAQFAVGSRFVRLSFAVWQWLMCVRLSPQIAVAMCVRESEMLKDLQNERTMATGYL